MKTVRAQSSSRTAPSVELRTLRARLAAAEETLGAIRRGEVDAVMAAGKRGRQVFTLEGADRPYRVLIESMNEGALTLAADRTILYANHCFARMVKSPLEQVAGGSFRRYLSAQDLVAFRALLKRTHKSGAKIQVQLHAGDGSHLPVQISTRPVSKKGGRVSTSALVVTDMTEAHRAEELMRALTNRVVQVQEAERARVALELHDHITQLLCAILFRCEALVVELSADEGPSLKEAVRLREMLGKTAGEVERISRNLRPGVLDHLGLIAVLRATGTEFAHRTGVAVKLTCVEPTVRLSAETELALYRILQEALKNVERHAHARHVTVALTQPGASVTLVIADDGVGFDPDRLPVRRKGKDGLGLLGMRERATYAGGTLVVKSIRGAGTEIEVRIPVGGLET